MIFSDRSIREAIESGSIQIDPYEPSYVQPSSVDLRVGNGFRVFVNHRYSQIDPRDPQDDLTQLVEVADDEPFMLHPGEFVLGSTLERVKLGPDVVARLEGKSSLGRLGLLIHSSLPGSEPVLVRTPDGKIRWRPIEEIVRKGLVGEVVAFDPDTLETSFHPITDRFEGPEDKIFEVRLASGRSVRVTAGHNLFTLDRDGELSKIRTGALVPGTLVAIPRHIPGPDPSEELPVLDLVDLMPETGFRRVMLEGEPISELFESYPDQVRKLLADMGIGHFAYYRRRLRLPAHVALQFGDLDRSELRFSFKQSQRSLPCVIPVSEDLAWLLGLYVAEGYHREKQVIWSNTDQSILDRVESTLMELGLPVYRAEGAITCSSNLLSRVMGWLEIGDGSHHKRVPPVIFGWPDDLVEAFLDGFVDGDGSREETRVSLWTCSEMLVADFLALLPRLGLRASASYRSRGDSGLYQISIPHREHKLLTSVPLPDQLLVKVRSETGLSQSKAAAAAGYKYSASLGGIEKRAKRDAVRLATLRRLTAAYASASGSVAYAKLQRLTEGGLLWDRVVEVRDTGNWETIFDIEVRPGGRSIENFLAGNGGVLVSNTAGFVDAGWDGHITLELSNVATLPIAIYPGMKIGQISFYQMTTEADVPYGSPELGSKYQGQSGPTASRSHKDFGR